MRFCGFCGVDACEHGSIKEDPCVEEAIDGSISKNSRGSRWWERGIASAVRSLSLP